MTDKESVPRKVLEDQVSRAETENRTLREAVGISSGVFKRALEAFGQILRDRDWTTNPEKWQGALREVSEKEYAALNAIVDTDHLPNGEMIVTRILNQQDRIATLTAERDAALAEAARLRLLVERYVAANKPYWSDNVRGRILCAECSGSWNYQSPEDENHDADCLYAATRAVLAEDGGASGGKKVSQEGGDAVGGGEV